MHPQQPRLPSFFGRFARNPIGPAADRGDMMLRRSGGCGGTAMAEEPGDPAPGEGRAESAGRPTLKTIAQATGLAVATVASATYWGRPTTC